MKVLLTGATGFVGRNYLLRALARGDSLLAPVRDEAKLRAQLLEEGVEDGRVEILPANPAAWPAPVGVDLVVHCAGALFERTLQSYLRTNVSWTRTILEAIPRECPLVVLSSQSAGGPTPAFRQARSEADADDPISFYGESKLRMERMLLRQHRQRLVILRPPMILGPRDQAIRQLFDMARKPLRAKPGIRAKAFSFIGCEDLLDAIDAAGRGVGSIPSGPYYVASRQVFSDYKLLRSAAACAHARGLSLPLPHAAIRIASMVVDSLPALRAKLPSLTRDRVRELFANRWVVDPTRFEDATEWSAKITLEATLRLAFGGFSGSPVRERQNSEREAPPSSESHESNI